MSSVLDYQQCPQCKFEQADFEYKCRTFEEYLQCRRCGYSEVVIREGNSEGQVTYKHKINEGAGVLFYRWKDAIGFLSYCLSTPEEVTEAEEWLRKRLEAGDVDSDSSYLARWNGEKKAVEFVIGTFYDFQVDDPPAPAKPAKPTIPIWIHPRKLQNYANSFELPEYRQKFLDMVQRKIDTHDQAWFTRDVEGKRKFAVLTEPADPAEWTRYEV
jgi:hypothetical protein